MQVVIEVYKYFTIQKRKVTRCFLSIVQLRTKDIYIQKAVAKTETHLMA